MKIILALLFFLLNQNSFADNAPCLNLRHLAADGSEKIRSTCEAQLVNANLVLYFFATGCRYCVSDLPNFESLAAKYQSKAVFRVIGEDEREEDLLSFFRARGFDDFEIAIDPDYLALNAFNIQGTPTSVVIGPDKKVKFNHLGPYRTEAELKAFENAINE